LGLCACDHRERAISQAAREQTRERVIDALWSC
jgi:hypothetical protein